MQKPWVTTTDRHCYSAQLKEKDGFTALPQVVDGRGHRIGDNGSQICHLWGTDAFPEHQTSSVAAH